MTDERYPASAGRADREASGEAVGLILCEWVRQAERDSGNRSDGGLTSAERHELAALRRENQRLRGEVAILDGRNQRDRRGSPAGGGSDIGRKPSDSIEIDANADEVAAAIMAAQATVASVRDARRDCPSARTIDRRYAR
jgi:hypothetical protein